MRCCMSAAQASADEPNYALVCISNGDAENARHEIAGHENAAPECKSGKCET